MTHFEKIEAYIEGWMTGPERAAFESELQTNAALKQDYEDWLEADAILKKNLLPANDAAIKEIVTPLTRQYFKQEKKQPAKVVSLKKYMISVAAAAAIIIIYFSVPSSIDNYNVPEMPQAVVRGSEALSNKGALLFNEGKYKEAIPLLQQQATANPGDATAQFFYAVSLVKTKQYKKALPLLEKLATGPSAYKEDAAFFAALSAYKLDKKEDAINYADMVGESGAYYKQVQKIINRLK